MKLKIISQFIQHPSVCICGYSFGYVWCNSGYPRMTEDGTWVFGFVDHKRHHFIKRHPRRWKQDGIA